MGKTLSDADAEFERGLDAIETACSIANDIGGSHYVNQSSEIHTVNEPLVSIILTDTLYLVSY